MKKNISSYLILLFGVIAFVMITSSFAQTIKSFSDLSSSHPNYAAIVELQNRGVIGGYPDGSFRPDISINRAEALKIILLGAGYDVPQISSNGGFIDVEANSWYAKYIVKAKELNIIEGYPDRTFKPYQDVNLVENLKILINANKIDLGNIIVVDNPYKDAYKNQWYSKYIGYAKAKNLIDADMENKIYPDRFLTRGKIAEILYRFIKVTEKTATPAGSTIKTAATPSPSSTIPVTTSSTTSSSSTSSSTTTTVTTPTTTTTTPASTTTTSSSPTTTAVSAPSSTTTPTTVSTPPPTTTTSSGGGGTLQATYFTSYGYNDNDDGFGHYGTAAIAYPDSFHRIATEGSGTYTDPVTFATDQREIPQHSIIYVPYLQKYFRMDDGCAECTSDWDSGRKWRTDLFMGGNKELQPGPALKSCEEYITRKGIMYINAGPGYVVDTTPLFSGGVCTARLH